MKIKLKPWEYPLGNPFQENRNIKDHPYSRQERRVAEYLLDITNDMVGAGDDPIGFLIATHAQYRHDILSMRKQLHAMKKLEGKTDDA